MKRTLFLILLIATSAARADRYYVEEATGTGIGPDESIAVLQLVRNGVSANGHTISLERDKADYVLRPKVIRLGNAYLMSLEKRRGDDTVFLTQMKARSIEDLDQVAARLTRAVLNRVPAEKDARVDDVTEDEETRGMRRRGARKGSYVAFGPAWLSNLNKDGTGFYIAGAYAWDVNRAMIRVRADFAINGGAIFSDFGFGASIFLSDRDFAPFIGVDVGLGISRVNNGSILSNDTEAGFAVGPVVGIHLLRTSSINIEIAGRAVVILDRGTFGNPVAYVTRLGLYF